MMNVCQKVKGIDPSVGRNPSGHIPTGIPHYSLNLALPILTNTIIIVPKFTIFFNLLYKKLHTGKAETKIITFLEKKLIKHKLFLKMTLITTFYTKIPRHLLCYFQVLSIDKNFSIIKE